MAGAGVGKRGYVRAFAAKGARSPRRSCPVFLRRNAAFPSISSTLFRFVAQKRASNTSPTWRAKKLLVCLSVCESPFFQSPNNCCSVSSLPAYGTIHAWVRTTTPETISCRQSRNHISISPCRRSMPCRRGRCPLPSRESAGRSPTPGCGCTSTRSRTGSPCTSPAARSNARRTTGQRCEEGETKRDRGGGGGAGQRGGGGGGLNILDSTS